MNNKFYDILKVCSLTILIVASVISYVPNIFADVGLYGRLHQVIILACVFLFALSGHYTQLIKHRYMNNILIPLILFIILVGIFYGIGLRATTKDIIQIGIIYICVWIGYKLNINVKYFIGVLITYCIVSIYLAYSSITTYLSSFSMEESMYMIEAKNQIGAIVAVATYIALFLGQTSKNKYVYIFSYFICAILFILLIYVRCRTALLALILTTSITIYKLNHTEKLIKYSLIGILILFIFSGQIIDTLQDAFIGDRNTTNLDELSSNRMERNDQAIQYLNENLFIGELEFHSGIDIIHNYVLNRITRYGIWGLPLIFIYFLFAIKIIKQVVNNNKFTLADIGFFILIIPFICSILEPDAPFGPGSVYSFVYILFGYSLNKSLNKI